MNIQKYLIVFGAGLLEQFGYTLYLIAVGKYLIVVSSILMLLYFFVYLLIVNYIIKEKDNCIGLLLTYAIAAAIGNYIAMIMNLIK
jgi:hypothetical protein